VTKEGADAADRNGIRGAAFALFSMKSQDVIRRFSPATFLHDLSREGEGIAYCIFTPRRGREVRLASVQLAFAREELQSLIVQLVPACPADPFRGAV
jgi:hypothetical protein